MKDLFDINLISEIQGLDRKSSISREQVHLKRKKDIDNKSKNGRLHNKAAMKDTYNSNEDNASTEQYEDNHGKINITV